MAFTTDDLNAVDRAIVALASGQRTAEVRFSDGRLVKYAETSLNDLRSLRASMAAEVATVAQDPTLMRGGVTYAEWTRD
ncbi:hypothetical protein KTR66_04635 [Roseococcus sp. SDR]|uniref:gpW family head-tail joining protein n=1 Tax=Roseococcus sp. SDR TaxID=2835532 RepID=UPI001BCA8248|nr:gpW family head-tail joining protein [Roseococcus sp. SDR]MBS7789266.1 hypothetical protein [Roseococcus sp. SDR]MBV1844580.1 hypothetical protein [Roseococcus sp. SDR]